MREIWEMITQVAPTTATVLIRGESGVGKDLVARAIHAMSPRADGPFVKVNCAALPATLLESELFGHEKGAFTGAFRQKPGQFEYANRGTISLDEIGELPRELQAKLLHVIQDLQFSRVGGRELIHVDVRIVATTNRDLEAAMGRGEFREDLYYRINVVEIAVPPLRERRETIPFLVEAFLKRFNQEYGRDVGCLFGRRAPPQRAFLARERPGAGKRRFAASSWSAAIVISARPSPVTGCPCVSRQAAPARQDQAGASEELGLKAIARRAARDAERAALLEVLERVRWNRTAAAQVLKVSYKTLLSKLTECGIPPARSRTDA